ncbi:hypothetical protein H6503_06175 [Candidatus Woesearchaeota archaeon]|nr:hypothetical protein [Candidatus Woesearchaeota archaeon]
MADKKTFNPDEDKLEESFNDPDADEEIVEDTVKSLNDSLKDLEKDIISTEKSIEKIDKEISKINQNY